MKLYTVINLAVQLNCRCACNGQRCWRRCSKRARNFRNFLIAANALHKWGSRGAEEGERGATLKGLLLKWKTSQKHISRTPRELHKKRKRFSFFFFVPEVLSTPFCGRLLWPQGRPGAREEGNSHCTLDCRRAKLNKLHTKSLTGPLSPFIGYVLVLASTHFKPPTEKKREERVREIKNAPMAEDCQ